MKIYFYHTRPIAEALEEWKQLKYPGHILYGLTHFERHGIESVLFPFKWCKSRMHMMLRTLFIILTTKEKYDVLYGTSYRGMELVIFLRALGLYRKPIVVWHHQAVPRTRNFFKRQLSKLFYRGLDCMFFFSRNLIDKSLESGKVSSDRLHLIHWGADLAFYDKILKEASHVEKGTFISTGKECRDFKTLFEAFSGTNRHLDVYATRTNGDYVYEGLFDEYKNRGNINIHISGGIIHHELAMKVARAEVVVIPCDELSYTVGLTTLVEAFALGKPVIVTDNPTFEMNIADEGAGLLVGYKNVEGWKKAIEYMSSNGKQLESMKQKSRKLAEDTYNLDFFAAELADIIKGIKY